MGWDNSRWDKQEPLPTAYLGNAFSLAMLPGEADVRVRDTSPAEMQGWRLISIVGHAGAAEYYAVLLGRSVPHNRESVSLSYGDTLFVGQIKGRLPEGQVLEANEMPPVKWLRVEVLPPVRRHPADVARDEALLAERLANPQRSCEECGADLICPICEHRKITKGL